MSTTLFLLCLCCVCPSHGIKIVSYNTGLLDSLEFYAERRPELISAIQKIDYDVLCLQEVWYGNDVNEVTDSIGSRITSLHMPLTQETDSTGAKAAPCAAALANGTINCIFTQCATLSTAGFTNCAFSTCRLDLESNACILCLTLDGRRMKTRCTVDPGPMNLPGIMLLSKRKVLSAQSNFFEEPHLKLLFKRAYISAKIAGVGTVICTHTTAFLGPEYFEPTLRDMNIYSSWEEQNLAETNRLTALAKSSRRSAVIVGDLNTNPAISTEITPIFPASYKHFIDDGFTSPYIDIDGRCTFCSGNPLVPLPMTQNFALDHVLIKPDSHVVQSCTRRRGGTTRAAERLLKDCISDTQPYPRSDHFAIGVDIVPLRRRRRTRH